MLVGETHRRTKLKPMLAILSTISSTDCHSRPSGTIVSPTMFVSPLDEFRVNDQRTRAGPVDTSPGNSITVGINDIATIGAERTMRPSRSRFVCLSSRQECHISRMRCQGSGIHRRDCKRSSTKDRLHREHCHDSQHNNHNGKNKHINLPTRSIYSQWPSAPPRAGMWGDVVRQGV